MIKDYKWRDPRNAVGWAAACARLALEFYVGDQLATVVAAIEIAERCAAGEEIDARAARAVAVDAAAAAAANDANDAVDAARAAADAADAAANAAAAAYAADAAANAAYAATATAHAAAAAVYVAANAVRAGVSQEAVDQAQLSAIASDLGLVADSDSYFAAIAALAIGNIDWAREIAETSECT